MKILSSFKIQLSNINTYQTIYKINNHYLSYEYARASISLQTYRKSPNWKKIIFSREFTLC